MSIIQTDNLTNVAGTKTVPTGDLVDGHCTAWVNFNGLDGTIRDSFNVASITRNSAGNYTINFATPMANSNYAASVTIGTPSQNVSAVNVTGNLHVDIAPTVNSYRVATGLNWAAGGALVDESYVISSIFGGK